MLHLYDCETINVDVHGQSRCNIQVVSRNITTQYAIFTGRFPCKWYQLTYSWPLLPCFVEDSFHEVFAESFRLWPLLRRFSYPHFSYGMLGSKNRSISLVGVFITSNICFGTLGSGILTTMNDHATSLCAYRFLHRVVRLVSLSEWFGSCPFLFVSYRWFS